MVSLRWFAKLAVASAICAVAAAGAIAGHARSDDGPGETTTFAPVTVGGVAPATGQWTPLTVSKPKLPIVAGGIPVDIDPVSKREDMTTTLAPLGDKNSYRMTIFNISNLGAINAFQWFPPTGVRVTKLLGSSAGHCTLTGLKGFGGKLFPTIVLYPNINCDRLDLKAPSCTCVGDGGNVSVSFVTDKPVAVGEGDLRLRAASLPLDRIPTYQGAPRARRIMRIATPAVAAGGLTASQRRAAQGVLDRLQDSNISEQVVALSRFVQEAPATCRIRRVSASAYRVYVFWIPWLAANPYVWLKMTVADDPATSTFRLGTAQPVLPGGRLKANGRAVNRRSVDTTLLSRYGPEQAKKSRQMMVSQGGDAYGKGSAVCQVLKNGALRLVSNR
jgi:hypothetical protein